jgi:hypothetical protein
LAGYLRLKLIILEISKMKKILAVAVATAISAPAMADLTIGGSTEYNISTEDSATKSGIETNVQFSASTTAENGLFAKAFFELEAIDTAIDTDDNYLQIGNAAANVIVGQKAASVAWVGGDDSFQATDTANGIAATTSGGVLYTGKNLDALNVQQLILNITAVEGLTLQVSGNTDTAKGDTMGAYASMNLGGVTLAANLVSSDASSEDGFAASASTTLGEAAVAVSYATNSDDDTGLALNVGFGAFDVTYARFEDEGSSTDESSYYGAYNVGDLGLSGLNIDVGAGSGSDRETKMGVEVTYSF